MGYRNVHTTNPMRFGQRQYPSGHPLELWRFRYWLGRHHHRPLCLPTCAPLAEPLPPERIDVRTELGNYPWLTLGRCVVSGPLDTCGRERYTCDDRCIVRSACGGWPVGSTGAIIERMGSVGLPALRQDASELVRRVEGGEEIEITVSGRIAARMVPAGPKRWQRWDDIADAFAGRPDPDWERDRDVIDQSVISPWEHRH